MEQLVVKDKMEIIVIKDKILVEKSETPNRIGDVLLPVGFTDNQCQGKVIKVGTGTVDEPMMVLIGDEIIFHKSGLYEIKIEESKYYVLTQSQVLAILRG